MNHVAPDLPSRSAKKPRGRFWMLLVGFMVLQLVAWTLWFTLAAQNPVAEVPLTTQQATPRSAP